MKIVGNKPLRNAGGWTGGWEGGTYPGVRGEEEDGVLPHPVLLECLGDVMDTVVELGHHAAESTAMPRGVGGWVGGWVMGR